MAKKAKKKKKLRFAKTLCCSTSHMTQMDSCMLSECPHLCVTEYPEGFYITLDAEDLSDDEFGRDLVRYGLSENLTTILQDAVREHDCEFVKFDRDEPPYECYTTYEW